MSKPTLLNLAERVGAGHTGKRANTSNSRAKDIEERAVDTMLDNADTEILSVAWLQGVSTMDSRILARSAERDEPASPPSAEVEH